MSLFNYLELNYQPVYAGFINLNQEEWMQMIRMFVDKLAEKTTGKILTTKLIDFVKRGYKIIIQNHDFPFNRTVYPKIRIVDIQTVIIVIPSVPYFINIDIVDYKKCEENIQNNFFPNLSIPVSINQVEHKHIVKKCEENIQNNFFPNLSIPVSINQVEHKHIVKKYEENIQNNFFPNLSIPVSINQVEHKHIVKKCEENIQNNLFHNLSRLVSHTPVNHEVNFDDYKHFISDGKQTGFISMAHELIHCLRFFEGVNNDEDIEEANTIYGIKNSVLTYYDSDKKVYMTENSIRNEWGMDARVSHNSKEIFCAYSPSTHSNYKKFTKQNFFECI
jgi:hypothetical protein